MLLFLILILVPAAQTLNLTLHGEVSCFYGNPYNFTMEILDVGFWKNTVMATQRFTVTDASQNCGYLFNVLFEKGYLSISQTFEPAIRIRHTCTAINKEVEETIYLKNQYTKKMKSADVQLHMELPYIPNEPEKTVFEMYDWKEVPQGLFDMFTGSPYDHQMLMIHKMRHQSSGGMH